MAHFLKCLQIILKTIFEENSSMFFKAIVCLRVARHIFMSIFK